MEWKEEERMDESMKESSLMMMTSHLLPLELMIDCNENEFYRDTSRYSMDKGSQRVE